ncbi:6-hydroxy-D-nicotine oxidase [Nannizzia gypsea CBS 118893]|uniref:6-hydroxy-D-nicotine oxidase n=1 Tax=Arthroderma gypseum (strain ATCC MYA-4604 / CBS 118893) TaxID=535722 RepID=E4V4P2_ARTGP|nr:6-hydroxy-D-nicotine oxidase [Nannizzia gypsea CBS 118893]EFR04966.1 6-hydroxy-D-nicotine oxidase [Nannizzia gypsea CBS 118893]
MRFFCQQLAAGLVGLAVFSADALATQNHPNARLDHCLQACKTLESKFADQVSQPNSTIYGEQKAQFWSSQQSETTPACFFRPKSSKDVAAAIKVLRRTGCPFAAKSGGHAAMSGASNIAGGVTIDFSSLKGITVSKDRRTVSLGAGNTWLDVYSQLQKEDLVAIGGRVADIGVGGLTLGGGISFFSNLYGWAADNVRSFEVVTASGDIIHASPHRHADLYWALRGGGNNFGLVTEFEVFSYPLKGGEMWGGNLVYPGPQNASMFRHLAEYTTHGAAQDPKSALIVNVVYLQPVDQYICVTQVEYAEAMKDNSTHPMVFNGIFAEPNRLMDTVKSATLAQITTDFNDANPNGLRESYWTATIEADAQLLSDLLDLWVEAISPLQKKVKGYLPVYSLEPIGIPMLKPMANRGGNALGLDNKKPIIIMNPSARWENAEDDKVVIDAYVGWLEKAKAKAEERGLWNDFVYMNYASVKQDPIQSYGKANIERLNKVARKYDPDSIFQRLQPGYFKL